MVGFGAIRGGQFFILFTFLYLSWALRSYDFSDLSYINLGERGFLFI